MLACLQIEHRKSDRGAVPVDNPSPIATPAINIDSARWIQELGCFSPEESMRKRAPSVSLTLVE